jgi:hypothetical protein
MKDVVVGAMVEEAMGGLWCCLLRGFLYFLRKMQCAVCFPRELDAAAAAAAAEDFGPILQDFEGNTTTKDRMSLFLIRAVRRGSFGLSYCLSWDHISFQVLC